MLSCEIGKNDMKYHGVLVQEKKSKSILHLS